MEEGGGGLSSSLYFVVQLNFYYWAVIVNFKASEEIHGYTDHTHQVK